MFRNYPLTTLFIIATVCVDLAVMLSSDAGSVLAAESGLRFYVWNYAVPAQFGALALWAVFGKTHRLTKAAWVTLACGMLFAVIWQTVEPGFRSESIAFSFIQFFVVMLGAGVLKLCGVGKVVSGAALQVSLIEFFGWTMIVALWAFALRFGEVDFLIDQYWVVWIAAASLAPLLLVPILFTKISTGMRLLSLSALYLFVIGAYALLTNFMEGPMPLWALSMAITQVTYITAWWSVVRMDEVMQERRVVTESSREKLKVFDPKEG